MSEVNNSSDVSEIEVSVVQPLKVINEKGNVVITDPDFGEIEILPFFYDLIGCSPLL